MSNKDELLEIKEQVNNLIFDTALNTAYLRTLQTAFLDFICSVHPENKKVYHENYYGFLNREQERAFSVIRDSLLDTGDSGFFIRRSFEAHSALQAILREVSKIESEGDSKPAQ